MSWQHSTGICDDYIHIIDILHNMWFFAHYLFIIRIIASMERLSSMKNIYFKDFNYVVSFTYLEKCVKDRKIVIIDE